MPASRRTRSSARRRAVVVSQAPGLGRALRARPRSRSAATYASCVHSSAVARSPSSRRATEARTSPHSVRCACSTAATTSAASGTRWRQPVGMTGRTSTISPGSVLGERERLVEVGAVDDVVAAERLLGLDERPVGENRTAVGLAHGRRRGRRGQGLAADDGGARRDDRGRPGVVRLHHLVPVLGGDVGVAALVAVDEEHVARAHSGLQKAVVSIPRTHTTDSLARNRQARGTFSSAVP